MESNLQQKNTTDNVINNKKRYDNVDLLKFIAICMVITLHVPLYFTNFIETKQFSNFIQYSFRLVSEGVLIFILVNGFLLINKPFDLNKHLKKTIKIFVIMILWGTINVIFKSVIRNEYLSINKIIKEVLSISFIHSYSVSLWFLQSLIRLYILFPIIKCVHDSNKKVYNYLVIAIIFFSVGINFLDIGLQLIGKLINIENLSMKVLNNFARINPFFENNNSMFLLYFVLGGILFEHRNIFKNKKHLIIFVLVGIFAWIMALSYGVIMSHLYNKTYLENYNFYQVFLVFTIIGIFALSTLYVNKNNNLINKFITSVGKNTMGIYLIHGILMEVLKKYINVWQLNIIQRLIIVCCILLSSWLISIFIMKIPKLNNIIKI